MNNEIDMDLVRMFAEKGEPLDGEAFVAGVSGRIARRRYANWAVIFAMVALLSIMGAAFLSLLTPWLMSVTGYVVLGSNTLAKMFAAPVGWAIGGGVGLVFFVKTRS